MASWSSMLISKDAEGTPTYAGVIGAQLLPDSAFSYLGGGKALQNVSSARLLSGRTRVMLSMSHHHREGTAALVVLRAPGDGLS